MRGFAPGGIGPRDVSNYENIQANALGGTTYYGASAEVEFPIFGLPKEIGLKGAVFADAGNLIGYSGQTNFSNFLGNTYCPPTGTSLITQPSCANVWDPNLIRASVGRELDLGLADGTDPIRFRAPGFEGQVRPDTDSSASPAARPSKLDGGFHQSGRAKTRARPLSHLTGRLSLTKIRYFSAELQPVARRDRDLCGAALASEADAERAIGDVAALDQAGPGDLTFLDNPSYLDALRSTRATAALVGSRNATRLPRAARSCWRASLIARWRW